MSPEETLWKQAIVRAFVAKTRRRLGITRLPGRLPELSCELHGEFHNLLWRVLLSTPEEEWGLRDPDILEGLYREVLWEERGAA